MAWHSLIRLEQLIELQEKLCLISLHYLEILVDSDDFGKLSGKGLKQSDKLGTREILIEIVNFIKLNEMLIVRQYTAKTN